MKRSTSTDYEDSDDNTIAYLSSDGSDSKEMSSSGKSRMSNDPSTSSGFESSDNEPLSKYRQKPQSSQAADSDDESEDGSSSSGPSEPKDSAMSMLSPVRRGVGRPRGKTQPPRPDRNKQTSIFQKKVRRDNVDEDCECQGIIYKRWRPLNPSQTTHVSVRGFQDATVIPPEQNLPEWCILCPRNSFLRDEAVAHSHYLALHHKPCIVVGDHKLLACKCSEMRSHGSDRSARNQHYHCYVCFHPFKIPDFLATHMLTKHAAIELAQVRHIMKDSNARKTPI